jgi:hypothetical protein
VKDETRALLAAATFAFAGIAAAEAARSGHDPGVSGQKDLGAHMDSQLLGNDESKLLIARFYRNDI